MSTLPQPSKLLDDLSVRMWEPPLLELWTEERLPLTAMNVLLILAFETDVRMSGLLGFLENWAGRFLPDIVRAFAAIEANATATLLDSLPDILAKHGVTNPDLRADLDVAPEYSISTFRDAHVNRTKQTADELQALSDRLYLRRGSEEPVRRLLEDYTARHIDVLAPLVSWEQQRERT